MFRSLRSQLLWSYLGVLGTLVGISLISAHQYVTHSLYTEMDERLLTIADAATHNLETVKRDRTATTQRQPRSIDHDGDLDLPWQDLGNNQQQVEWFDRSGQKLGTAGKNLQDLTLIPESRIHQSNHVRSLTVAIHESQTHESPQGQHYQGPDPTGDLQGYVRVSEGTQKLEADLSRFSGGLAWGGLSALLLAGLGGCWLARRSLRPIEQSYEQLKQFTADASHELRSPLTVVKTSIDVVMNHPERIHPADAKKLRAIASATNEMTQLVDDLLLLARRDANSTASLVHQLIPLDELLEDLIDAVAIEAEAKGIQIQFTPLSPVQVHGDAKELRRLFLNLLHNAIQYTPAGGTITVVGQVQEPFTSLQSRSVVISLEDTGVGIASEQIPLVFNRFWRADQARDRREGGTGLGLAIAQAIAQGHGGSITVNSQVGVGSCFQVWLPIA
jgi:signal transduction histidine kinase